MLKENVIIVSAGGQDFYIETFFRAVKVDGKYVQENPESEKVMATGKILEVKTYVPFKNVFIEVKIPANAIVDMAEEINKHMAKTEFINWED